MVLVTKMMLLRLKEVQLGQKMQNVILDSCKWLCGKCRVLSFLLISRPARLSCIIFSGSSSVHTTDLLL